MSVPLRLPTAPPARLSLKDSAVNFIVDLIVANDLTAGDGLPSETKLAEAIGVSRVVVREACQVLAARGIVEIGHGRGIFVSETDAAPIAQYIGFALRRDARIFSDLLEVRFSFETQAAGLAARRATEEDIASLVSAFEATEDVLDDFEALAVADVAFHRAIFRASKNRVASLISASFDDLLVDSRRLTYAAALYRREGGRVALAEHRDVLDAIGTRNAGAAEAAMTTHLRTTEQLLNTAYSKLRSASSDTFATRDILALAERESPNIPSASAKSTR